MLSRITLIIALLSLYSCGSSEKKTIPKEEKAEIVYPSQLSEKLANFPKCDFDFEIDSLFFEDSLRNSNYKLLTIDEVRFLSSKLYKDELTESNSYYLKDYEKIEKAKQEKKYEEFVEKLDIGMMKDATCHAIGRLEFGDSIALLIWKIDYSSYEACPFFSGMHLLGSIVSDGKIIETIQLAGYESAADAPMNSEIYQLLRISEKGRIKTKKHILVSEMDEVVEEVHQASNYKLSKSGFVKL